MKQRIRPNAKRKSTFNAMRLDNQAVGGRAARQLLIADSGGPTDVKRSFSREADADGKARAREMLDYCFVGQGFDQTVDREDAYRQGQRQIPSDQEKTRRRAAPATLHPALGL